MLMHAYRGEEPSQAKAPRGAKTQAFIDAQRKRDWERSAYHDGNGFHIPPEVIEAAIAEAATRFRKGTEVKRSLSVVEDRIPLLVPQKDAWAELNASKEQVFAQPEHVDTRGVALQGRRIDRCRPIFRSWRLRFTVIFADENIQKEDVEKAVAGMCIGDFRPRFGRIRVLERAIRKARRKAAGFKAKAAAKAKGKA